MAKKKARRSRVQDPAVDPNQRRRERLEARRAAKAEALAAKRRAEARERIVRRVVILLLIGAAFWFFILRTTAPTEIAGHTVEDFGSQGVNEHTDVDVAYDSTPPVSGAHRPPPAPACGVYAEQIEDESQVHALEHGAVMIQYDPVQVDPADIAAVEAIAKSYDSHVISAPYGGMETPITVSSWGKLIRLDSLDEPAIREYIDEFRQKAPEDVDCPMDQDTSFQPLPEPTPEATPSPEETSGNDGKGKNKNENETPEPTPT